MPTRGTTPQHYGVGCWDCIQPRSPQAKMPRPTYDLDSAVRAAAEHGGDPLASPRDYHRTYVIDLTANKVVADCGVMIGQAD